MTARHIVVDATPYGPFPSGARRRLEALLARVPRLMPEDVFEVHWAGDGGGPPATLVADNLVHDMTSTSYRGGWRRVLRRARALRRRHCVAPFTHLVTDYGPIIYPDRVRAVVTVHDLRFFDGYAPWLRGLLRRSAARRAWPQASLIACSDSVARALGARGFSADVIYGAAGEGPYPPRRPTEGLLVVGRDEPRKAWGAAQAAAREVGLPLTPVTGATTAEALTEAYATARWLLAPSLYEGFNLPIVEALAVGCPVLASRIEVHQELVDRGATGLVLVPPPRRSSGGWQWPEAVAALRGVPPESSAPPAWSWDDAAEALAARLRS